MKETLKERGETGYAKNTLRIQREKERERERGKERDKERGERLGEGEG